MRIPEKITDATGWVGTYPFRGIPNSSLDDLEAKAAALGIGRVVVSPFDSLFWQNNLDGFRAWSDRLGGRERLEHWPVVNPAMVGQIGCIETLVQRENIRGLRLLPNYHGYRLSDPCVEPLMRVADTCGLVVQLFQRIADERWHWMLHTPAVAWEEIAGFLTKYPGHRILLSGSNTFSAAAKHIRRMPHLYVDISRMRGPVFAVEKLLADLPAERIIFGSLWPIQIIEATLWQVQAARVPEETKRAILHENFNALVAGSRGRSSFIRNEGKNSGTIS